MTPYIILIIAIFIFRGITLQFSEEKGNTYFLILTFIYLYLFCVLRSFDVGIDIPGYIKMYNLTATKSWEDWTYVYFENGYIALMKICNMIGLSSRGFFYIVYLLIIFPIYLLLKKFSVSPLTSVILFISYQCFTFDLTALRQGIAMSICIFAFILATKPNKKNFIIYLILIFSAFMIHRSSLLFLPAYFLIKIPINNKTIIIYSIAVICCIVMNEAGITTVLSLFDNKHYTMHDELKLGLSILLIIIFIVCAIYAQYNLDNLEDCRINGYCVNLLFVGLGVMFLFNGSNLLRSSMYYTFPLIISTAYTKQCLKAPLNLIFTILLYSVMLTHFFLNELNTFNVTPYEIGTEQALTK